MPNTRPSLTLLIRELTLALTLTAVLATMISGFFVLGLLNVPQDLWQSQTASGYLTIFIMVFAPVFALARVIEWWVNTCRRFSIFWQEQENQE